ncbi:hypothetical protein [Nannocystis punicea]|uniref:Myxococcus cysteine-rich repeat-containing protein n=1 Tax=Nannocystis punicea TaxID=2995304 RepID=A0ABY7H6N1_9BACT|nr:hypothetical protein [Nannocystis poenicansa]WAS94932.1 hypothetical protein O0S08_02120 [Nannocystis poenicansa]
MPFSTRTLHVALAAFALPACIPSIIVGDSPQDEDSTATTTASPDTTIGSPTDGDSPTGASTDDTSPTLTTGEPLPGVCGDGVVDADEACDDGDADPDDGCAADCTRVGVPLWTHTFNGPANLLDRTSAVAFDPSGRVIVVGTTYLEPEVSAGLILVLDPAGAEVWKKVLPAGPDIKSGLSAVTVDDAGTIYAAGYTTGLAASIDIRAFDPAGAELWTFSEPGPADNFSFDSNFGDLAVTDDALFSCGFERISPDSVGLVARRHQKDGGSVVWRSTTTGGAPQADGKGLAVAGANVVVVGHAFGGEEEGFLRPIAAVFDDAGGLTSVTVEEVTGFWRAVAAIGAGGDVVLAGSFADAEDDDVRQLVVRRLGPDGGEVWTRFDPLDVHAIEATGVAIGAGEEIVVSGAFLTPEHQQDMVAARLRGDGGLVWAATYDNAEAHENEVTSATAFGPDFVVVAGHEMTLTEDYNGWVRAYAIE